MGLDMYLSKKTYVKNWDHYPSDKKYEIVIKQGGVIRADIKPDRISYIIEEIGYWRKANQIHKWFVDNCQGGEDDCREATVSYEKLKELYAICKKVKGSIKLDGMIQNGLELKDGKMVPKLENGKKIQSPAMAKKLLPIALGVFFGSVEYDEYAQDIDDTIGILRDALSDEKAEYYYQSSW